MYKITHSSIAFGNKLSHSGMRLVMLQCMHGAFEENTVITTTYDHSCNLVRLLTIIHPACTTGLCSFIPLHASSDHIGELIY